MNKKTLWIAGIFIAFLVLFSIPFYLAQNSVHSSVAEDLASETQVAEAQPELAQLSVAKTNLVADESVIELEKMEESSSSLFAYSNILTIFILSIMSTLLSWTVVDKAKKKDEVKLLSFSESKKLLEAMTNETCRQILETLASDRSTATQLSEKLKMSIQRVHYNLNKLQESGLIEAKSYQYSPKGNEMNVYSLKKKYFVIGPED